MFVCFVRLTNINLILLVQFRSGTGSKQGLRTITAVRYIENCCFIVIYIFRTVLLSCAGNTPRDTVIALALPLSYIGFFSILSLALSYKVRKLPSNFQARILHDLHATSNFMYTIAYPN